MGRINSTKEPLGENQLYTPQQVALRLGLTRKTVYRMIASGRIHAIKFSRKAIRISSAELLRFIAAAESTERE
jgi:excisionase family DNA binding protein